MTEPAKESILLAHGGGGQLSSQLIQNLILKNLANETLSRLNDSAVLELEPGRVCFTTDSYVVKPLFFPGGDIGKLAVCGTVNDLAVQGARPAALSLALIIETGLEIAVLERILKSIATTAKASNVNIVTGDTKTVEAGAADAIFINTAGVGVQKADAQLGTEYVRPGDAIIVSGTVGDHGMTIISQRDDIKLESPIESDCAAIFELTNSILEFGSRIRFMRDPTRGGLSVTLNDIAAGAKCSIEIKESAVPVTPAVRAAADMLGFDLLEIANEGKLVAVVDKDCAEKCVEILRKHPLEQKAAVIGHVLDRDDVPIVEMVTNIGGRRIVQMPSGRLLPRIC